MLRSLQPMCEEMFMGMPSLGLSGDLRDVCGEPCANQVCRVCASDDQLDAVVDMIMQLTLRDLDEGDALDAMTVTLKCGHTFTVETLDGITHLGDFYTQDSEGNWAQAITPETHGENRVRPVCPSCRGDIDALRYGRVCKSSNLAILQHNISSKLSKLLGTAQTTLEDALTGLEPAIVTAADKCPPYEPPSPLNAAKATEALEILLRKQTELPTPSKTLDQLDDYHGFPQTHAKLWKGVVKKLLQAYRQAQQVTTHRDSTVQTYEASLATLFEEELDYFTSHPTDTPENIEQKALRIARMRIGQPPPRASLRFTVEAFWVTIRILISLAETANQASKTIRNHSSDSIKNCTPWSNLAEYFLQRAVADSQTALKLAEGSESWNKAAKCQVIAMQADYELVSHQCRTIIEIGRLTGAIKTDLVQTCTKKLEETQALRSKVPQDYVNRGVDDAEARTQWIAENFLTPTAKILDGWKELKRVVESGVWYSTLTKEESRDIVRALSQGRDHISHTGHFFECINGHPAVARYRAVDVRNVVPQLEEQDTLGLRGIDPPNALLKWLAPEVDPDRQTFKSKDWGRLNAGINFDSGLNSDLTPLGDRPVPTNEMESTNIIMQHELNRIGSKIEQLIGALSRTPDNHPDMPFLLIFLGTSHEERFDLRGEPSDIDKAIEYTSIAVTLAPDDDSLFPALLGDLGTRHSKRFQRLGGAEDNDKAIEYTLLAVSLAPEGHPELPGMLGNLGTFHCNQFERLDDPEDLKKAIEYESRAFALTPTDHPSLPLRLANIGRFHSYRFQCHRETDDIEKAISYQSNALASIPDNHPDLPLHLTNLGNSYHIRFEHMGDLSDLDRAIKCMSRAVERTPEGHPYLSLRLGNLGACYGVRFKQLGEPSDLERAIQFESRAVELTPHDHTDLPSRLTHLGISHCDKFKFLGDLTDLEKAIEYESRALSLTPDGHPSLLYHLTNLGVSLTNRFERLGDLNDIKKAIEYTARAVELTPDEHFDLPSRLNNLGALYTHRFHRLGEMNDLEEAIKLGLRALAYTPHGHPDLPMQLTNLGVSYTHRFEGLRELGDLEKSIEYKTRALSLTPDSHSALSERLHNLGVSYNHRFHCLGKQEDLERVIECMSCALALTPDGHPNLPHSHFALAKCFLYRYTITRDRSHSQEALDSYRLAAHSIGGSPRAKFNYAMLWAKHATEYSSLNCMEAYQTAINLLPQFIWLGATTNQRYRDLEQEQDLAVRAAHAAILASRNELALEWLEHARCVVWNQNLMLRSPLDHLRPSHPSLANRLETIAAQLHHVSSESQDAQASSSRALNPEQVARQHRQLAQEYDNLINQARNLPGFEDFLRPIKAVGLVKAARNGPIVVINCHQDRCDALVIMPERDYVDHVPLPNFNGKKAHFNRLGMHRSVRNGQPRERGAERRPVVEDRVEFESVLSVLWYDVVKPVLDFLGYTNRSSSNLPHITWCPTGALSFLPLHAAGDYFQPRSKIFDYVISSYTPTLTALLSSTRSSPFNNSRVLAIGQPNTPGHSPLPGTVDELAYLKKHTSGRVTYSELLGDQAKKLTVIDAMEQHDWVHLACHAHQNVQDPTKSGFFLHDATLDLAEINRRSFKNKGLAYLSACQTATGDERLPDEAIHLASGMLMAGYSSVIATMWSVMDNDAPFVADKVYAHLMRHGRLENGEAGKALHYAVEELRERVGVMEFRRWVPYIHIGS